MFLNQKQVRIISDISEILRLMLPWKNLAFSDPKESFLGVCEDLGLSDFYRGTNAVSGIRHLLESTLESETRKFPKLMVEIIKRGIGYSGREGKMVYYEDIERINYLLLNLGYKIPELLNHRFLNSLSRKSDHA